MSVKVRFAPSPTGHLHVGNCRTALINWLFARAQNGTFLLRIDDTDPERSTSAYETAIREDLAWLGLTHDEEARQSNRLDVYAAAAEKLKAMGRLYPCYETPEELTFKRKLQRGQGRPPLYDRAALSLTAEEIAAHEAAGRKPHWRFKLDDTVVEWQDLVRGPVRFEGAHMSDPVLIREDGRPIYTLASVVDDIDMHITHIVRGEDHVANTAVQCQLINALGHDYKAFTFAHLSLLTGKEGEGLSKRLGSLSIGELRENNILPMAINSLLGRLGTSLPVEAFAEMAPLIDHFSFDHFSRATPKFSEEELSQLNTQLLHKLPFDKIADQAAALVPEITESFWVNVQRNLTDLGDLKNWWTICRGEITPVLDPADKDFIDGLYHDLKATAADVDLGDWFKGARKDSSRKGKQFFMPFRLALTGQSHGPELPKILHLMGRDKALMRLKDALSA